MSGLPLLPKRKWVSNSATDFCNSCCIQIESGFFKTNKHHCRYCGNIVCSNCSQQTFNKHRICDSCKNLIESICDEWEESESDTEKEELSPYNTPMLKFKEFSVSTHSTIDYIEYNDGCEQDTEYIDYCEYQNSMIIDDIMLPPPLQSNLGINNGTNNSYNDGNNNNNKFEHDYYGQNALDLGEEGTDKLYFPQFERELHREYDIKRILVFGFVRECWRTLLQFNNRDKLLNKFPCNDIINMFVEWLTISDSFDEYNTNINLIIGSRPLYQLRNYRKVEYVERTKEWNMECYHTFGNDTISRGARKIWKFKISGHKNNSQKPCILIGIIETNKIKSFINMDNGRDNVFNDDVNGGYCLYTADWNIYHNDTEKGIPFTQSFDGIDITPNDVIAVELDLTQKYGIKNKSKSQSTMTLKEYSEISKCGTLKFIFNGNTKVFKNNGIAFDDIDINKSYKLAIGMYLRDKLAMYQVL